MFLVIKLSWNHIVFWSQSWRTPAVACWALRMRDGSCLSIHILPPRQKALPFSRTPVECPAFVCVESQIDSHNEWLNAAWRCQSWVRSLKREPWRRQTALESCKENSSLRIESRVLVPAVHYEVTLWLIPFAPPCFHLYYMEIDLKWEGPAHYSNPVIILLFQNILGDEPALLNAHWNK